MEPQLMGPGVLGAKCLLHLPGPDSPGGPEFANFLEEIVVGVEEKAEPRRELVYLQTPLQTMPDVFKTVS